MIIPEEAKDLDGLTDTFCEWRWMARFLDIRPSD